MEGLTVGSYTPDQKLMNAKSASKDKLVQQKNISIQS